MTTTDPTSTSLTTTASVETGMPVQARAEWHHASMAGVRPGDGADDPITGPMPALDLLDGQLRAHVHKGVTVVALDGGLDDALARRVAPVLPSATTGSSAVVLDVDQVTLLDRSAFELLASSLDSAAAGRECCVVTSRLSGRMVLERWDAASRYAIFSSVADALQAREFAHNGYGSGWRVSG